MLAQQRPGYHGEDGGGAAVHDRRTEAPHNPSAQLQVGENTQVIHVLQNRESGTDREAVDRGIHEEADPVAANQGPYDQGLEALFDERRDITGV